MDKEGIIVIAFLLLVSVFILLSAYSSSIPDYEYCHSESYIKWAYQDCLEKCTQHYNGTQFTGGIYYCDISCPQNLEVRC